MKNIENNIKVCSIFKGKKKQRKKETPSIERRRKYATVEKKLTAETDKGNPETNIRKTSLGNTLTLAHKQKLNLQNSLPVLNYRRKGITIFIPLRNKFTSI